MVAKARAKAEKLLASVTAASHPTPTTQTLTGTVSGNSYCKDLVDLGEGSASTEHLDCWARRTDFILFVSIKEPFNSSGP